MPHVASSHQRLHDLDALRAGAMLLGILYHVALSFALGFPWMVQDVSQTKGFYIFESWVHGFRMQLFMLVSGFFTAMLWRQKGLKALLWHRCRRVLFPCLLGLVTVVPAMNFAFGYAFQRGAERQAQTSPRQPAAPANLWEAIRQGDRAALDRFLPSGAPLADLHPFYGTTPLTWAALVGDAEVVARLIDLGAAVDARNRDGGTALHAAVFLGRAEVAKLLIQRGADVNALSGSGETPLKSAEQGFETVQYIAGLLGLPVEKSTWETGRATVRASLLAAGGQAPEAPTGASAATGRKVWDALVQTPVFLLIWFLWFLVWLVAFFTLYAGVMNWLGWQRVPAWLTLSPARLLWLVPATLLPTWFMQFDFGPDTSMGIIPMPHVLLYYALFFFFGAFYYDTQDRENRLGNSWRWSLPLTLLVIFPLALEFATGTFGLRHALLPAQWHRPASVLFQSIFAWAMSFACIGMFRALLTRESHAIRYLSDSSYWLYLAHLPLCIVLQVWIAPWRAPALVKFTLLSVGLTAFLLLTYHWLVRYTWIGRLLNGPRKRNPRNSLPPTVAGSTAT